MKNLLNSLWWWHRYILGFLGNLDPYQLIESYVIVSFLEAK